MLFPTYPQTSGSVYVDVIFLSSTVCGKIAKDDVRNLERCSTVERALCTGLRRRRILTRPGIRVPLLPQGPADLVHGDDCFIVGRQKAREHAEESFAGGLRVEQSCHLGTRGIALSVTFLGRTQTLRKRGIEYEPGRTARSTLIESTGADRCSMCGQLMTWEATR